MNKSGSFWFSIVAVALVVAGIVGTILSWGWLYPDSPMTASNSETLRNVGLIIGGVLAFVFAGWRAWVAERQANAARDQAAHAQRQADTAQQSLLNERYQRGAEMLGSDALSVRLGGIYALQRLAEEHPEQYHIQIMRLFCAFARHQPGDEGAQTQMPILAVDSRREDIQAVATALGNRGEMGRRFERETEGFRLELQGAYLRNVDLRKANLSGANLSRAHLLYAILTDADLTGADLSHANMNSARMQRVDVSGANLFHAELIGARLCHMIAESSNLSRTNLHHADLSYSRLGSAKLADAHIGTANLSFASLQDTDLSGAVFGMDIRSGPPEELQGQEVYAQITQRQLDAARAETSNPPNIIRGTVDIETGEQLIWHGHLLQGDP